MPGYKSYGGFCPSYDVGGAKMRIAILYSILRACIGSMLAARRAGMKQASIATAVSVAATIMYVVGSVGFTP